MLIPKKRNQKRGKESSDGCGRKEKGCKTCYFSFKEKNSQRVFRFWACPSMVEEMEKLLEKEEFELAEYMRMRRELNDIIERIMDEEMRFKLRDSCIVLVGLLIKSKEILKIVRIARTILFCKFFFKFFLELNIGIKLFCLMWKYYAAQGKWYIILIDKTIQTRWDLCLRF